MIYKGAGVADDSRCCSISRPLTTAPLHHLMCSLKAAIFFHVCLPRQVSADLCMNVGCIR